MTLAESMLSGDAIQLAKAKRLPEERAPSGRSGMLGLLAEKSEGNAGSTLSPWEVGLPRSRTKVSGGLLWTLATLRADSRGGSLRASDSKRSHSALRAEY